MKFSNFEVISRMQSPSEVDCLIAWVECEVKQLFSDFIITEYMRATYPGETL